MLNMEQKNEKHGGGDIKEEEKEGGIMTGIISDLVEGRKIENLENEKESDDKIMTIEPGNGGIISNIISKLVSPNQELENNEKSGVQTVEKEENEENKSGGILTNIISKLVSPNQELEDNEKSGTQSDEKEENEEHNRDGGNIIGNIVSHLPSSLTDDVDPPTDEASILIHSIIHD